MLVRAVRLSTRLLLRSFFFEQGLPVQGRLLRPGQLPRYQHVGVAPVFPFPCSRQQE